MKRKVFEKWVKSLLWVCAVSAIFIIIWLSVSTMYADEARDNFCRSLYPSNIEEPSVHKLSWSSTIDVELGYVRCCRRYYNNHEREIECKIFPRVVE